MYCAWSLTKLFGNEIFHFPHCTFPWPLLQSTATKVYINTKIQGSETSIIRERKVLFPVVRKMLYDRMWKIIRLFSTWNAYVKWLNLHSAIWLNYTLRYRCIQKKIFTKNVFGFYDRYLYMNINASFPLYKQ